MMFVLRGFVWVVILPFCLAGFEDDEDQYPGHVWENSWDASEDEQSETWEDRLPATFSNFS